MYQYLGFLNNYGHFTRLSRPNTNISHELSVNAILQEMLGPKSSDCCMASSNNIFSYLETLLLVITHEISKPTGIWRITSRLWKSLHSLELGHSSNKQLKCITNQSILTKLTSDYARSEKTPQKYSTSLEYYLLTFLFLLWWFTVEPSQTPWEIITIRTTRLLGTAFIQMKSIRTLLLH